MHKFPDKSVTINVFPIDKVEQICDKIRKSADNVESFQEALKQLYDKGKTLIVDEAHLLFAFPELVSAIIKNTSPFIPNILLFSAATTGQAKDGNLVASPY